MGEGGEETEKLVLCELEFCHTDKEVDTGNRVIVIQNGGRWKLSGREEK